MLVHFITTMLKTEGRKQLNRCLIIIYNCKIAKLTGEDGVPIEHSRNFGCFF
jgi:hypothetical protein